MEEQAARVVYQSSSARFGNNIMLEAKYFERCEPGTLGGDGITAWKRYHMAKLGNAAFSMALSDVFPGYATSNLQNMPQNGGRMLMFLLNLAHSMGASQSPADGSLPASVARFGPNVDSGDFYAPDGKMSFSGAPEKTISKGKAVKAGKEKETVNEENKSIIMDVTLKALGLSSFI